MMNIEDLRMQRDELIEKITENCKEHKFPKDELLDIAGTSFSPGVRRLMAKSGSADAFEKGSLDIKVYSGIDVTLLLHCNAASFQEGLMSIGKTEWLLRDG